MPFRIFCIGDLHVKLSNSIETELMTTALKSFLRAEQYDFTVILGDVLDRFESIHVKPLTRAVELIGEICSVSKHTFLLIGNHDRANNNVFLTAEHPFTGLKKWANLTVVDAVVRRRLESETGEEAEFVFVPYVAPGRLREALRTVALDYPSAEAKEEPPGWEQLSKVAAVFAHQEFYGAKLGIKRSIEGDTWPLDAPLCVSGHIHDYEQLQPNLYYVGTPIQHGVNDITKKTVSSYLLHSGENGWTNEEKRLDLNVPKKIHVTLTPEELLNFELPANATFVRIDLRVDPLEYKQLLRTKQVKALLAAKVQLKLIDVRKHITKHTASVSSTKMSYARRLEKSIRNETAELQALYSELFGPIAATPAKRKAVKIRIRDADV